MAAEYQLIKDMRKPSNNDLCIVGSGAIGCDFGNHSSWTPIQENLSTLAKKYGFFSTNRSDFEFNGELFCAWIGESCRLTTLRLAHHLTIDLLNYRKKKEGGLLKEN